MSDWTQPCCGDCWYERNANTPSVINPPEHEICCYCGMSTYSGIYIRIDPESVPFATRENK